jgi:hypothetical protein
MTTCKLKQIKGGAYYNLLDSCLNEYLIDNRVFIENYIKNTGYSNKRLRWNIMRAAYHLTRGRYLHDYISKALYPEGLNDTHIDTAFKQLTAELIPNQ